VQAEASKRKKKVKGDKSKGKKVEFEDDVTDWIRSEIKTRD